MNIVYLKYAITIAKAGSLSKAAEELFIAQPNLSRAVKELERELGITIFDRNSKGITLTEDGERLIGQGRKILEQIEEVEEEFREKRGKKTVFSISVPRADYIAKAFGAFSMIFGGEEGFDAVFKETGTIQAIANVLEKSYKLGIVRYPSEKDRYFKDMIEGKNLAWELITEFRHVVVMRTDSPLAELDEISFSDLENYIEVVYPDSFAPSGAVSESGRESQSGGFSRRIPVYDRASMIEILETNYEAFAWASPMSVESLGRYGFVQKRCAGGDELYKDVLVYRKQYRFSRFDKAFLTELCASKRKIIDG